MAYRFSQQTAAPDTRTVALYVRVSTQMFLSICREFGINEVWLRTGEGGIENMFTKLSDDDRYSINLGKLSITENQLAKNMLNAIAEASPEKLKHIEEFMKACLGIED